LEEEDMKWKQRAKETWLKHGDHNTKYFHACVNVRSKRNLISQITDGNGTVCSTLRDIEQAFILYFQDLFIATLAHDVGPCVQAISTKATGQMNQQLLTEFTMEEVSQALTQIAPNKLPGPDGFSADFYPKLGHCPA